MARKTVFILLIILGCSLLLASITFWVDSLTSTEPIGLGQQILKWISTIMDVVAWISAYYVHKKNNSKAIAIKVSGGSPQIPTGDNARSIQVNQGNYIENVGKIEINISPPSKEEQEKNKRKYELRNKHEFEAPRYLYKPIQDTVIELKGKLEKLESGYVGVFGPPGSGKSTFLTQTLRTLSVRLVRYYAYVPDAQDPSVLRGESINFFHDITLSIQQLGVGENERPDPTDRVALIELFNKQLLLLGKDYETTKTQTIILVDGLDHIAREQHPERSLITDLPSANVIPKGVFIIVGSQTKELTNLPISIQQNFSQSDRTIFMGKLTPQNVFDIIHQTLSEINTDLDERIYQIVDGHPLSLIYLLNALVQSETPDNYETILEKTVPYQGNIEEQYFSHWKMIESDQEFENFLGLLARIRGPIPMNWVAQWAEETLLKKVQKVFGLYFLSDSLDRWEFFHNSFRIFLEAKTSEALPGLTSEQINQKYHLKLAQQYEKSDNPWKWETLYHYYKSGDHTRVIDIAQYDWFRSQIEELRPIDAIETDVRLAIKSAGELLNTVALVRYTLIGASLQQRSNVLEDTQLPHLLIEASRNDLAIDYARDGARLRLKDKTALSFSRNLYDADLKREAIRIFELAEPLEYLSGHPISKRNAQPQDLYDLLSEWVESASLIRSPVETAQIIRRIKTEPLWNDEDNDILRASIRLQNWLLRVGALSCCDREDWNGWQIFFDSLDKQRDHEARFFTLLRTIEHLRGINQVDHARELLTTLLNMAEPIDYGSGRNRITNLLSIAESVHFLEVDDYQAITKQWFEKIQIVPLSDREIATVDRSPKLIDLHFRYARLKFILNSELTSEQLLSETENKTFFEAYEDYETKSARRQIAFIAYTLAKLWVDRPTYASLGPSFFLSKIKWIFDLLESGWNSSSATFRLHTEGAKEDISEYLVICAARYGSDTLEVIKNEFAIRWKSNSISWWAGIQRDIVLSVAGHEQVYDWAKNELDRIESFMLQGLDVYGRVQECEKQAKAWLYLEEKTRARNVLFQLIKCARGVYSEKDYQLIQWANWIRKTNSFEITGSNARIKKFLGQIFEIEDTASGVDDALLIMLQAVFDVSPHKSIQMYKNLLERKAITYEEGMTNLLFCALETEISVWDVWRIMEDLLFPFARNLSSELIIALIIKTNATLGRTIAIELSEQILKRIMTDVLIKNRASCEMGIYNSLIEIGVEPSSLGFHQVNLEEESSSGNTLDYRLHLSTSEQLNLQETFTIVSTVSDLRGLLEKETRQTNNYFEWHKLATHLLKKVSTLDEINEICDLMKSRISGYFEETHLVSVYTSASERLYELGYINNSKQLIQKAVALTRPSGWTPYWDGGVKHAAMRQVIKIFGEDSRKNIVKLYAQDLSERHRYPTEMVKNLDDIAQLLFDDIPYLAIWPDLERFLDDLFSGIVVGEQAELNAILDFPVEETFSDDASNALAELLILYLDFPAYPVFNGATKASAKFILADNLTVKNALKAALKKHDQLVRQVLIALEIVSIYKPEKISSFQEELTDLQKSPNIINRMISTKISINTLGKSSYPPMVDRVLPAIYSLHLPDIATHHTEDTLENSTGPVLLSDPALQLQPFDIEAREIAKRANVAESNLLYHTVEKLREIEVQRTWLVNGSALEPNDLTVFLDKINLRVSHNKPKIFPNKNSLAQIAAELYDAHKLSYKDLAYLEVIFRDYDPTLFLFEAESRPDYIGGIGGLPNDMRTYVSIPKDWDKTLETSIPLLMNKAADGRIILGEWTHLKRLESEWPTEERILFQRAMPAYKIWEDIDLGQEKLPFANTIGLHTSDYLRITNHPERDLVIAHQGYRYQMEKANWLGINPQVGFDMGWQPMKENWFSWKDKNNQLVVESIYWQDGNFDSNSWYDHVEVGYGWLVLITETGYQEIKRRYGPVSRGAVIRRSLGQFGSIARNTISLTLNTL